MLPWDSYWVSPLTSSLRSTKYPMGCHGLERDFILNILAQDPAKAPEGV